MPAPLSTPPDLKAFLDEIENRVVNLEQPLEPQAMARLTSANLTTANALKFAYRLVYLTDINQLAYSNAAHWYKVAVGTLII